MSRKHKRIAVIMDASVLRNGKAAEAMRMTVGLTLRNPQVHLLLLDGIQALCREDPGGAPGEEFKRHFNAYLDLGCSVFVENGKGHGAHAHFSDSAMEVWSREEMIRFITQCEVVVILEG